MKKNKWTIVLLLCAILAFIVLLTVWIVFLHPHITGAQYAKLAIDHVQAFIGLPMAAICSLILVAMLRQRSGEGLQFKALGVEITGPSGEVVLWNLTYLTIALTLKLLW